MNMHLNCQQLTASEEEDSVIFPVKEKATALTSALSTQLDVCRCPKCDGPMTARNGARGPYFHCLCFERARGESGCPRPFARVKLAAGGRFAEGQPFWADNARKKSG
jgi:hypothetical protein